MNVAMNGTGGLIEVQGTAEAKAFSRQELNALLDLAEAGVEQLLAAQLAALSA
jgi:ribonuclease PH